MKYTVNKFFDKFHYLNNEFVYCNGVGVSSHSSYKSSISFIKEEKETDYNYFYINSIKKEKNTLCINLRKDDEEGNKKDEITTITSFLNKIKSLNSKEIENNNILIKSKNNYYEIDENAEEGDMGFDLDQLSGCGCYSGITCYLKDALH